MRAMSALQATSRESLHTVRGTFDAMIGSLDDVALNTLSEELAAASRLLHRERVLRRHLADSSTSADARQELVTRLFGEQVGGPALDTLRTVVGVRWSRSLDLLNTVELLARVPLFVRAERAGSADEIEDELFRFGRILESEPRLASLLTDVAVPSQQRDQLLDNVIADKVRPVTRDLIAQVIASPRGRQLDDVVEEVAELAAARREESVAHVRAAAALTADQEQRLGAVLSRIYGRHVMVRVDVDPDVVGGLVIRVGDEVIDGSVAAKLERARHELLG